MRAGPAALRAGRAGVFLCRGALGREEEHQCESPEGARHPECARVPVVPALRKFGLEITLSTAASGLFSDVVAVQLINRALFATFPRVTCEMSGDLLGFACC